MESITKGIFALALFIISVQLTASVNNNPAVSNGQYQPPAPCDDPDVPTLATASTTVCPGSSITIYITGNLDSAAAWSVYENSCGGSLLLTTTADSFDVIVSANTTYYVRGEGNCVIPGSCGSISITASDNTAPGIICPGTQVLNVDSICEAYLPDYTILATTSDNCPGALTISQNPVPGTLVTNDVMVMLTAMDGNGNLAGCNFMVQLEDNTTPVAVCQNATVYLDANGLAIVDPNDLDAGSYDNCSFTASVTPSTFTCGDIGVNPVVFTVTDNRGNQASCNAQVTVVDNISPVAVCKNINIALDANGFAVISGADIDGGSTDNCSINSLVASQDSFTCGDIGNNAVILTVTDNSGNSSQCTATVTISDTVAPVAICQPSTVYLDAGGSAAVQANDIDNGSYDACGSISLSVSPASLTCNDLGTQMVTLTATDNSGNSSSCQAMVTVLDTLSPVFTACPGDITQCDNVVTWSAPVPMDNCGVASVTSSHNSGDYFPSGTTTTVSYTAIDSAGNTAMCSFIVSIEPNLVVNAGSDITTCENNPVNIGTNLSVAGGTGIYTYQWTPGTCIDDSLSANPLFTPGATCGTTDFTIFVMDDQGCYGDDDITVQVDTMPVPAVIASGPICINAGAQQLAATPSGGSWTDGAGTNNYITTTGLFDPQLAGLGFSTVIYNLSTTQGCSASDTTSVEVVPLPDAGFTLPATLCASAGTITLTPNQPGGTFTGNGVSGSEFDPEVAGGGNHQITYTITDANGCSNSATSTIEVLTVTVSISPVSQFCENGQDVQLTATPGGGTWMDENGQNNYVSANGLFNPQAAGAGIVKVYYTVNDTNGCAGMDSVEITVNASPVPVITATAPVCADALAQTLNATPAGGTWYDGAGTNTYISPGGSFDPQVSGTGSYVVQYEVTNTAGCTATDVSTIEVIPLPDAGFAVPAIVCINGGSVQLTPNQSGGIFSGSGVNGNSFDPAVAGTGNHHISYTITDSMGCSNSATEVVEVQPVMTVSISPAGPYCENAVADQLVGTPAGGYWTDGNGQQSYISSNGIFNPNMAGGGSHIVIYSVPDTNGCAGKDSMWVVVDAAPVPVMNVPNTICEDASLVQFTASPSGGSWTDLTGGNTYVTSNGSFDPQGNGPGNYGVIYETTLVNGCTVIDTAELDVVVLPDATFSLPANACVNESPITMTPVVSGGSFSGNGVIGNTFDPMAAGLGTHTITYTVTDTNSCANTYSTDIEVKTTLTVSITPIASMCQNGDVIQLQGNPSGGNWMDNNGQNSYVTPSGVFDPKISGSGTHQVYYAVADTNGCTGIDSMTITVNPIPDVVIGTGTDTAICEGTGNIVLNTSGSGSNATYYWTGAGLTTYYNSSSTFQPYMVAPGSYTISVEKISAGGCIATDTMEITVNPNPDATFFTGTPSPFCGNGKSVQLYGLTAGGVFYGTGVIGGKFHPSSVPAGNYVVNYLLTDVNGCSSTSTQTVKVEPALVIAGSVEDVNCNENKTGTIELNVTGGKPPYNYFWPGSINTKPIQKDLPAGAYEVTVTDAMGCMEQNGFRVDSVNMAIQVDKIVQSSHPGAADASIDITVSGGTAPYDFIWSTGDIVEDVTGLQAPDTFRVTAIDMKGCRINRWIYVDSDYGLGVDNPTGFSFNLHPNPTSGRVTLTMDYPGMEEINISVLDAIGRAVYTRSSKGTGGRWKEELDISHFAAGNYLITVQVDDQNITRKIILTD